MSDIFDNQTNRERLVTLKSDLSDIKKPAKNTFFRHFLIHSADFLSIINALFNEMNNAESNNNNNNNYNNNSEKEKEEEKEEEEKEEKEEEEE